MKVLNLAALMRAEVESGTGLVLRDGNGRYLFALAGTRFACAPGELFYCGVGGHREEGEDWEACASREACEEIGTAVRLLSSDSTWYVPTGRDPERVRVQSSPAPRAVYEMPPLRDAASTALPYTLVIFEAELLGPPVPNMVEVRALIALTREQVIAGLTRRLSIGRLVAEGAAMVGAAEEVNIDLRCYPVGTAVALGRILQLE
jgi:hypothetical protein